MAKGSNRTVARKRSHHRHPIFLDPLNRRAGRLRAVVALAGLICLAWLTTVFLGFYYIDILPESEKLELIRRGALSDNDIAERETKAIAATCTGEPLAAADLLPGGDDMSRSAYLMAGPDWALATLTRTCGSLDSVLAEWLTVDPATGTIVWLREAGTEDALRDLKRTSPNLGLELVALLPLPTPTNSGASILDDANARARIVNSLEEKIRGGTYSGICIYPQQVGARHLAGLRLLMSTLKAALPTGIHSCLVVEADGGLWRDGSLVEAVDSVLLQAFREPYAGAPPGPLAAQSWFETLVDDAAFAVGPDKLRLALGSFAYMWTDGDLSPVKLPFAEAMELLARQTSMIAVETGSLNTRATFTTEDGRSAEIWLLDAVSLHNQILTLMRKPVAGVVLWSTGLEDPGAWPLIGNGLEPSQVGALETIGFTDYVSYSGDGPFRRVTKPEITGKRRFFKDPTTGLIDGEIYDRVPRPISVERYGSSADKVVAITFDDGPDPDYTVSILDVLKAKGVPATFFVIGTNVVNYPSIVRRMVAEGHEVGSHTFFHPEGDEMGVVRAQLELNALQRLIASVTGRTTYLFRTPYGRSEGPLTKDEATQQSIIEKEGYMVAGSDIVPRDWEFMSAIEITDYVMAQMASNASKVIVMHDAGGDRSATVAALPMLIDRLRAEGYRIVLLSEFLGLSRDEMMPLATDNLTPLDRASFVTAAVAGHVLVWIFWVAVCFGIVRSLIMLSLALLRRRHPSGLAEPLTTVTIAIPAFNEELVIVDGVAAALASDYPDIRVIVIDDGSTDGTADTVERAFRHDPRVRLIRQKNGGKCSALNAAYAEIETEVVVAVDADTLLHPKAVRRLMGHFADPHVGAIAGNVKVGNRRGLLARLQALEYITAQNIDRRAAERLNAMLVVPGAIGAWRVEAVRKVGFYSPDTITEDADLTVAILRAGYRIAFEERAYSITDAPETLSGFMKQRLRWSFGMMQTAWKHRRAAKTARGVGLVSIPDLWLTGIVLGLLAPLADAVFVSVIIMAAGNLVRGIPLTSGDVSLALIAGWVMLPILDLILALFAFRFERRENLSLLLLVPLQRLIYRPLLYITIYRAVGHALAGRIAAWGKLIRIASIRTPAG